MSYGTGIFGLSPLGVAAAAVSTADPAKVSTSRQIDPLTGRFVQTTAAHGYAGMPDAVQRVYLLVRRALSEKQGAGLITPDEQADTALRIRAALAKMVKEPSIELIDVVVGDDGRDAQQTTIVFRDLSTGQIQTIQPRL